MVLAMWALVRVMADLQFSLKKLALSSYFVNANLNKSKKMRERWVYGMIYLGSIMFFRRKKYRLISQYESFLAFHFCTIIAEVETYGFDFFKRK